MIPEEQNPKVHHMTAKGARTALAHRLISQDSYRAVLRGELSLAEARELGRDRGPHDTGQGSDGPGTTRKTPREARERSQESMGASGTCLCGCREPVRGKKSKFRPGHDMRLYGELKRNLERDPLLRNERFNDEQRAYARERGLI
jgi:hypothetical protein